jgi:hypothetical protein
MMTDGRGEEGRGCDLRGLSRGELSHGVSSYMVVVVVKELAENKRNREG